MGCTCSRLDQQKQNRRKYPYRNTSNPRPNVEAFGGSQARDDHSASPTGIAGFSDHGASHERARSLGEETVNTGETSSTYVRSPAAVALTARYQSAAVSAHPSLSPTPGSARTHHTGYPSPAPLHHTAVGASGGFVSSAAPSPFAVGKGPVYINGTPDGVVTVDEADAPSPSPPSSDDSDSDEESTTSSDAGEETQKTTTTGGAASPTRREGTLSQPRDAAPVPDVDPVATPASSPAADVAATAAATTPVRTPSRGAAVGRGSASAAALSIEVAAVGADGTAAASIAGDGLTSPNPLRGGSADREVELAVAASAKKKARKVEPVLAPLESSAPTVALVNQTPRKVALGDADSSDDEAEGEAAISSDAADDVDVSPPDSPMTSLAPSPTTADAVEESKVARAVVPAGEEKNEVLAKKKQEEAVPAPAPQPTLAEVEVTKLLAAHTGPAKTVCSEEEQAWQNLCRRHTTGVTAVLRATREEYNRLMRQLEDAQQRARKTVDTDQLGAIGRIRREFEEKLKKK